LYDYLDKISGKLRKGMKSIHDNIGKVIDAIKGG